MDTAAALEFGVRGDATILSKVATFLPFPVDFEHRSARQRTSTANEFDRLERSDVLMSRLVSAPALIKNPRPSPPEARQRLLQMWIGSVGEISRDDFVAVLRDQTDRARPNERVTIGADEVDPQDRSLFAEGATFYWFIFEEVRRGTRRIVTDLRFRRLPAWSKAELEEVKRRAADRARRFNVEQHNTSGGR